MVKTTVGKWLAWILVFSVAILITTNFLGEINSDLPESNDLVFSPTTEYIETELSTASSELQISPIASPTSTPTLTPNATPSTQLKFSPTPTNTPTEEINAHIDRFGNQYGVDPNVIRHIAICESGLKSNATNGPYVGLFQYAPTTWSNIRKEMNENPDIDLRYSAKDSIQTAAYSLSIGKGKIWPNCMP